MYFAGALVVLFEIVAGELSNPYEILGVKRSATQQEIRKSYIQLVKEWYVHSKFIKMH